LTGRQRAMARALHRALVLTHRGLGRAERLARALPLAVFDSPDVEAASSNEHYDEVRRYRRTDDQRAGLFPYEARALEEHFPGPPARILVPGAGAGRELLALLARGYDARGFDPVPSMVRAAKAALGRDADRIVCASVQTWRAGEGAPFDGVLAGWTMWTHLVRAADRLETLRSFRRACPHGPVLLSFWRAEPVLDPLEAADKDGGGRIEAWMRTWVRQRLFGLPPLEPGTGWEAGMWVHYASERELRAEADRTGYRLAFYERNGSRFPNAVLVPAVTPERAA
jgi:hypothetical protein